MIASIRGVVTAVSPRCIVDVGGVGFELLIPEKDRERLSPESEARTFHTYLYVREDRLNLFGFMDAADRDLFLRLIDVSGVGPRLALGALSLYPSDDIVAAIRRRDAAYLQKLPGLGKKTAERICIELADKLDDFVSPQMPVAPAGSASSSVRDEAVMALTSLGMTRPNAEKALERIGWSPDDVSTVEEIVREALRYAGTP